MDYIIKDVGKPARIMSSNEVISIYGTRLSVSLLEQKFVTSVVIADNVGRAKTTITKKEE